jgi:hypothetical protein
MVIPPAPALLAPALLAPARPAVPPAPPPLIAPPALAPALGEPEPVLSASPPQPASAVAEASVAPNANVAARLSRLWGKRGSGVLVRSSDCAQNGHSVSLMRT